jgi:hypothetical protein
MGCDCCNKWDVERDKCTASLKYRTGFCDVTFPGEIKEGHGSNYTKPKKRRKKK